VGAVEPKNEAPGTFARFREAYGARFSPAFLATGVVLIWIQCILYARYIHVDGGTTTIAINFSRCLFIAIAGALAFKLGFPERVRRALGVACIGMMTVASVLFLVQTLVPTADLVVPASILAGVGLAWGGGQCIEVYARLEIHESLLYTFLSLAFSVMGGLVIAFIPETVAYAVSILLPALILFMFRRSQRLLDERERSGVLPVTPPDDVLAAEPRSTTLRLLLGIALFSFVLGVSRGFPYGQSIELAPASYAAQFLGVALASLLVIWWALVRGRGIRFSVLWQAQLAAMVIGVILLSTFNPVAVQVGATLIAITNLFQVAFFWFLSYDYARHRAVPVYLVLAAFWLPRLLFRETGRLTILAIGPNQSITETVIIAVMVSLLALSMAFLLTDNIPLRHPFFADLEPRDSRRARAIRESVSRADDDTAGQVQRIMGRLQDGYGLTQREAEIALEIAQGRSTAYIAQKLFLSDNTVRTYVRNIYAKVDIHRKQEFIDFVRTLDR